MCRLVQIYQACKDGPKMLCAAGYAAPERLLPRFVGCGFSRLHSSLCPLAGAGQRRLATARMGRHLSLSPQALQAAVKSLSSMFMWWVSKCTKTLSFPMSLTSSMACTALCSASVGMAQTLMGHELQCRSGSWLVECCVATEAGTYLHACVAYVGLVAVDNLQAILDAVVSGDICQLLQDIWCQVQLLGMSMCCLSIDVEGQYGGHMVYMNRLTLMDSTQHFHCSAEQGSLYLSMAQ